MTVKNDSNNSILRFYRCSVCNSTHQILLNKNLINGRTKFPFPHIILHSEIVKNVLKEFLVMLYVDKDLQIRGAELLIGNEDFFTREQMVEITNKLMQEIELLRQDNVRLSDQIHKLQRKLG